MKLKILAALFLLPLLTTSAFGREKKDYDEVLKRFDNIISQYSTEKYYEDQEFKNKKTGVVKKFDDFTDVQKFTFFILSGISLHGSLEEMHNHWLEELNKAEETVSDPSEASKKDVQDYLRKLRDLRRKNAVKLEGLANEFFDKWPNEVTQEEKKFLLKTIQDYHDKHNLIKRD